MKRVKEILFSNIKEESLRTYLFTYSSVYDSISMDTLGDMFELDKALVHSVISKMIINEELMVSRFMFVVSLVYAPRFLV